MEFFTHVIELISAHIVADLIIGTAGLWFAVKLYKPAKNYWRNRKWLARAATVGISNFFPSRESYAVDRPLAFADYIRSADKSLRYFGHWLAFTIDQHHMLDRLCEMANSGKTVQLILLDPDIDPTLLAAYARYLGEDSQTLQFQINATWNRVRYAREGLSTIGKRHLELRRHQEFIPYSAFWFDKDHEGSHILVDMKLYGASRRDAYGIELRQTHSPSSRYPSLFERYAKSLAQLESKSEPEFT